MNALQRHHRGFLMVTTMLITLVFVGCSPGSKSMDAHELTDFAERYTEAWGSQNAASVASFFSENGSLRINDAEPTVGREAITELAQGYMTALPDMVLEMDSLSTENEGIAYYWTLIATNSGPDGNGKSVRISGFEEWTLDPDGLIQASQGHMDTEEYQRQLREGVDGE